MTQRNDATVDAIRTAEVRTDGQIDDLRRIHLNTNGIPWGNLNDMVVGLAVSKGFGPEYNDGLYDYLGSLGYIGTLTDRRYAWWVAGGIVSGAPVMVMSQLAAYLTGQGWLVTSYQQNVYIDIQYNGGYWISHDDLINHVQGTVPSALWNDIIDGLAAQGF